MMMSSSNRVTAETGELSIEIITYSLLLFIPIKYKLTGLTILYIIYTSRTTILSVVKREGFGANLQPILVQTFRHCYYLSMKKKYNVYAIFTKPYFDIIVK